VSAATEHRAFESILFRGTRPEPLPEPEFFRDLNLDQVLDALVAGRDDYDLRPLFCMPLRDPAEVGYRQDVLRDLEDPEIGACVREFAEAMRTTRTRLEQAEAMRHRRQAERWFLSAAEAYCGAVPRLHQRLGALELRSDGLQGLREFLNAYIASQRFDELQRDTEAVVSVVAQLRYCVHIQGARVRVTRFGGESDYTESVERTFAKFQQGAVKDYRVKLAADPEMNHVEAQILDGVAAQYPGAFGALEEFARRNKAFVHATLAEFDREAQFCLAYLEYIAPLKRNGLRFCYPDVSASSKEERVEDSFDLALAEKLVREQERPIVTNGYALGGDERIIVVTGPNQGGKTTFARMFGQLHHLAALGLPVPGSGARLFLPDRTFTHFEREEDLDSLGGKLDDELVRIHDIFERATADSLIVLNELFSSTTLADAIGLGTAVLSRVIESGMVGVCVTFVDELASLGPQTVSMMSTVAPDDPAVRTFRVVRKPADGLAYAAAVAAQYGLSYEELQRRVSR
jgi:DNA mismatch repair protein MutS